MPCRWRLSDNVLLAADCEGVDLSLQGIRTMQNSTQVKQAQSPQSGGDGCVSLHVRREARPGWQPVDLRELEARIKATLRRTPAGKDTSRAPRKKNLAEEKAKR